MRKVTATLTILILMTLLGGVAAAGAPEGQRWESLLADAVPGPMEGVHFSIEKVDSNVDVVPNAPKNIYPYLAYTAATGVDFYSPPVNDFTVGVGELWLNDYIILLNNSTCGITVIHLLLNQSGGEHMYWIQEIPDWCGDQGSTWRVAVYFAAVPELPGQWIYLPITRPADGDGWPIGSHSMWPLAIHY